jgi:dipeptidase E
MKLFLSSMAISSDQGSAFLRLTGKDNAQDVKIALIENAGDVEAVDAAWKHRNRDAIQALGYQIDLVDLREYLDGKKQVSPQLEKADAIWLGGGNTYYLRWILHETKADIAIQHLVQSGKVYGGGSAGAIVAGPTLKYFEKADDPQKAPEHLIEGLGLIDTVVIPHWQNEKYGQTMRDDVHVNLEAEGYKTVCITDEQALVIDGDKQFIVP